MKPGDKVRVSDKTRMLAESFGSDSFPPSRYCGQEGVIDHKSNAPGYDWEVKFKPTDYYTIAFNTQELELL